MKKIYASILALAIGYNTYSQTVIMASLSGTVKANDENVPGPATVVKDASLGYVAFDMTAELSTNVVSSATLTVFMNNVAAPINGNKVGDVAFQTLEDAVTYNDAKTGNLYGTDWTWNYGTLSINLNERGLQEIQSKLGAGIFGISLINSDAALATDQFNFIAFSNTFYGMRLTVNYAAVSGTAPRANFGYNKTDIAVGQSIAFSDSSTNTPTAWEWKFDADNAGAGAESMSTIQNPTMTYTKAGKYSVSLKATNGTGNNTVLRPNLITVYAEPKSAFSFEIDTPSNPLNVSFTDSTENSPQGWTWDFGDGKGASNQPSPLYIYDASGTYNVCLTTTNIAGSNMICSSVTVSNGSTPNGINPKNANALFEAYPNPASQIINITINKGEAVKYIIICDVNGKEVFRSNEMIESINTSNFARGIYNLTVNTNKGLAVQRIVIQ